MMDQSVHPGSLALNWEQCHITDAVVETPSPTGKSTVSAPTAIASNRPSRLRPTAARGVSGAGGPGRPATEDLLAERHRPAPKVWAQTSL